MLEFDGRLRLYYAFRPKFCRGQLPALLQRVGLDASDVDALVCNACATDGLDDPKTLRRLNNASKTPCGDRPNGALVLDFDAVRGLLEAQMRRDAGGPIYKVRNKRHGRVEAWRRRRGPSSETSRRRRDRVHPPQALLERRPRVHARAARRRGGSPLRDPRDVTARRDLADLRRARMGRKWDIRRRRDVNFVVTSLHGISRSRRRREVPVSAEFGRSGHVAARHEEVCKVQGMSTSRPRRRRNPSSRDFHVAAARRRQVRRREEVPASLEYPRSAATAWPRPVSTIPPCSQKDIYSQPAARELVLPRGPLSLGLFSPSPHEDVVSRAPRV